MSRPAIAHISLDAFRHNYRLAKRLHNGKAMAVVKANAYGHGAVPCALAIADEADGYAVACVEEALELRLAGIKVPILLLEGFFDAQELPDIAQHNLWIVIHHRWQLESLLNIQITPPLHVWLKMDTGMHRVGLSLEEIPLAMQQLNHSQNVATITLMTHFANADNFESTHTLQQLHAFNNVLPTAQTFPKFSGISMANSAGILGWPETSSTNNYKQWCRPGIMLYGADPLFNHTLPQTSSHENLRAVMQLTSRIISIRTIEAGESIGYGSLFTADKKTIVGVVAIGYADGYPRSASNLTNGQMPLNTPVAINGQASRLIGRVSMDMLFVDLTHLPNTLIGSKVELWGDQIAVNEVALKANTIAYELLCNVKRVQFEFSDLKND